MHHSHTILARDAKLRRGLSAARTSVAAFVYRRLRDSSIGSSELWIYHLDGT